MVDLVDLASPVLGMGPLVEPNDLLRLGTMVANFSLASRSSVIVHDPVWILSPLGRLLPIVSGFYAHSYVGTLLSMAGIMLVSSTEQ